MGLLSLPGEELGSKLLDFGGKLIDRLIPDPAQKAQAALDLAKLEQTGELAQLTAETGLATAQIDLTKAEAQSAAAQPWYAFVFVAGWRPACGWAGASGLWYCFLIQPIFQDVLTAFGSKAVLTRLDIQTLMILLSGMLGLGTLRTKEKLSGVAAVTLGGK
jgi:hypothetical protein